MMLIGDGKEVILLLRPPKARTYRLVCIGRKAHYRKDGSCKHTEEVLANIKPGVRVRIDGFGGKQS